MTRQLTGRDIPGEIAQFFSGDWQAFSRAGVAWRHIGEALERIGKNIDHGLASLDHAWDGTTARGSVAAIFGIGTVLSENNMPAKVQAMAYDAPGI